MSVQKTDLTLFRRLRPAEVCDACPTGRGALNGDVGGSPMGLALKGYSVGWGAAGRLRGVPSRASQWSGRAFRHAHALDLRDRHRLTQENGRERLYPLSPNGLRLTCPFVGVARWRWSSAKASPQGEGFGRGRQKSSQKIFSQKKVPKSGPVHGQHQNPLSFCCVSIPKDGASEQRAVLKNGCRAEPCDSFPLLSYKESRAPAGQAGPRGAAPRGRSRGRAYRVRTNGGRPPAQCRRVAPAMVLPGPPTDTGRPPGL